MSSFLVDRILLKYPKTLKTKKAVVPNNKKELFQATNLKDFLLCRHNLRSYSLSNKNMVHSAACLLLLAASCTVTANGQNVTKSEKESTNNDQSVRTGGKESANSFHEYFPWKKASKDEDCHFYGELEMCGGKHFLYFTSTSVLYSCTMKCYISCFK